jgi:hypothetical protein
MISTKAQGFSELIESLHNVAANLAPEVYAALGKAGNKTKSLMAKVVVKELNVKEKIVKQNIKLTKNRELLSVTSSMGKSNRIAMQNFNGGAKQTKTGVKAKISKTKGAKTYTSAFTNAKLHGNVFKRKGKKRFPLTNRLRGPSPWGVLSQHPDKVAEITAGATEEVRKQLAERIRYLNLKKSGGLNWQQNTEE